LRDAPMPGEPVGQRLDRFASQSGPAGVYVIDGNKARWQPTDDANRVILGARLSRQCCGPWWVVC
jgi:hypothetical protein